jgi:hypothetical protein
MRSYISLLVAIALYQITHAFVLSTIPNSLYTTFEVYYPDSKLNNGKVFLRGDNCNLTWTKGLLMNKTSTNQWKIALLCPENNTISVKALLNDSNWMLGSNRIFQGG